MDLKLLLEKEVLSEDTKSAILEAWEMKIRDAKEEITANLREEFANKFEHDKNKIIEAADELITNTVTTTIAGIVNENNSIKAQNEKALKNRQQAIENFEKLAENQISIHLKEFSEDRKNMNENLDKVDAFIIKVLSEEIAEFRESKRSLERDRVNLLREQNKAICEAKNNFVKKSAGIVEGLIENTIRKEFSQLHEDIKLLKKNAFGMKIFEAFYAEFSEKHFNENTQLVKLKGMVKNLSENLAATTAELKKKETVIAEANKQVKIAKELRERNDIMSGLLGSLARDKKQVMEKLLERTPNHLLKESFKKYLPVVLSEKVEKREIINESKEKIVVTGNRPSQDNIAEIIEIKSLLGRK